MSKCKICKYKGWCPNMRIDGKSGKILVAQKCVPISYCPCQTCLIQPICINACVEFESHKFTSLFKMIEITGI